MLLKIRRRATTTYSRLLITDPSVAAAVAADGKPYRYRFGTTSLLGTPPRGARFQRAGERSGTLKTCPPRRVPESSVRHNLDGQQVLGLNSRDGNQVLGRVKYRNLRLIASC